MTTRAEKIVAELSDVIGLNAVDAYRGAFTALALANGWPPVRIARYLGVKRARAHQRIDKLHQYASRKDVPTLTKVITAPHPRPARARPEVGFEQSAWAELEFGAAMLDIVG